jgi:hypothetical protein
MTIVAMSLITRVRQKIQGGNQPPLELRGPVPKEDCTHELVCSRTLPVRPKHDIPLRPWPYYEDRICACCGTHERLFHSRAWMRDHFLETHPDRIFPRVLFGPFRRIDETMYLKIVRHFTSNNSW